MHGKHINPYLTVVVVVGGLTAINLLLLPAVGYRAVAYLYLFGVLVLALFLGLDRGPVLLAAFLSAMFWNFLFIPPRFTFAIHHPEDILMFGMYFVIAAIVGNLMARIRSQERAAVLREQRTAALYKLARAVARARNMAEVMATAVDQIGQAFGAEVALLLPEESGRLGVQPHPASTLAIPEKDLGVAFWSFEHRRRAGQGTDTLPAAEALFLPLLTPKQVVGVMAVRLAAPLTAEQEVMLETCAGQIATAVERERQVEIERNNLMLMESERLYRTLISSISHELRTPITAIGGALSHLRDRRISRDEATRDELLDEIQEANERLNRVVQNLLDMARLETGMLRLNLQQYIVRDLVQSARRRLERELAGYPVTTDVPEVLPLVQVDFGLLEQVLTNLLRNCIAHTPAGTPIAVAARARGDEVIIQVSDRGSGLPPEVLDRIFDKFYRAPDAAPGGTGLGLSICRGLVEAHGGTIQADSAPGGGLRVAITLPAVPGPAAVPAGPQEP